MNELAEESTQPPPTARRASSIPPAISAENVQLLKGVEEDIIKLLAESQIDTNVFSAPEDSETPMQLKENEQNVAARAREVRFNAHIQQ